MTVLDNSAYFWIPGGHFKYLFFVFNENAELIVNLIVLSDSWTMTLGGGGVCHTNEVYTSIN